MIEAFVISHAGLVRKTNEDSYLSDEALQLFVVADGMGGHTAGEIASRLAIETIQGFVQRSHGDAECSWPYGIDPQLSLSGNRLRTAINLANRRVYRLAESRDDYTGMGTTVAGVLVFGASFAVGHVGDSRLYLQQRGACRRLTQDDTWLATVLAQDPEADWATLARHPMRNVLTNVVGAREELDVHVAEHSLVGGELLLLCTDGLHGLVKEDTIGRLLKANRDPASIASSLVEAALDAGGTDNVTAMVLRYSNEP